jgi:hypothetical protein
MTTVPQMVARANSGHYRMAVAVRDGSAVTTNFDTAASLVGKRTVSRTLSRWNVLDDAGKITETGLAFILAYEAKWPRLAA